MKKLLIFTIFMSFLGEQVLSVSVGAFSISVYRLSILAVLCGWCYQGLRVRELGRIVPKGENRYSVQFMLSWLLYAAVTIFWVKDLQNWVRDVFFISAAVLETVVFSVYFHDKSDIQEAFYALQAGSAVQGAIGWYEIFTGNYIFATVKQSLYYNRALSMELRTPMAMTGNPNDFALMMFFGICVSYICFRLANGKGWKIVNLTILVSDILLLVYSQSRSGLLGLLLALAAFTLFSGRRMPLLLIGGAAIVVLNPQFLSKIQSILVFNLNTKGIGSDGERLNLVRNGLLFLLDTFGFGIGAGQENYWMRNFGVYPTGRITNIHNWWFEILTDYGVWIFIGYLIFYCKLFLSCWGKMKQKTEKTENKINRAICASMIGFVIASIGSSSNTSSEWLWIFWAILIAYQGISVKIRREGSYEYYFPSKFPLSVLYRR